MDSMYSGPFQRKLPEKPGMKKLKVEFNGERIAGFYLVLDARSPEEKDSDMASGKLKGDVFVFLHGHGQRPTDLYKFTSRLAIGSRSGIVIVPVCDTPYGDDKNWIGDRGKDVILMEMARYVLYGMGIDVYGYEPMVDMEIVVDSKEMGKNAYVEGVYAKAGITAVGWSHGGVLARRLAHAYPASIKSIAQMCPAGYGTWTTTGLLLKFFREALFISGLMLEGYTTDVLGSALGITRGVVGDIVRAIPSGIMQRRPYKILRPWVDISDAAVLLDDSNMELKGVESIVVIFGADDSLINASKQVGIKDLMNPKEEEVRAFWERFYPEELSRGVKLSLKILPGNHLGPATHTDVYLDAVLRGTGDMVEKS